MVKELQTSQKQPVEQATPLNRSFIIIIIVEYLSRQNLKLGDFTDLLYHTVIDMLLPFSWFFPCSLSRFIIASIHSLRPCRNEFPLVVWMVWKRLVLHYKFGEPTSLRWRWVRERLPVAPAKQHRHDVKVVSPPCPAFDLTSGSYNNSLEAFSHYWIRAYAWAGRTCAMTTRAS